MSKINNTPKIRFKGFNEEWEVKRIGDIGEVRTGKTPPTFEKYNYQKKGVMFITPTDIKNNITKVTERNLSQRGVLKSTLVKPGTTLVTCIASIGKNTLIKEFATFNQQINSVTPFENHDPYFVFVLSNLWSYKMKKLAAIGTMQIVNKKDFSNIETIVPEYSEQEQIGNFFKNLDEKIETSSQKIKKIENFKKALMEKIFV